MVSVKVKGVFLALTLLVHLAGTSAMRKRVRAVDSAREGTGSVPEQVAYGHLFRQIMFLDRKARELGGQPQADDSLRTFLKRQADLNDGRYHLLSGVAADCERATALIDEKARAIIEALKFRGSWDGLAADEWGQRELELGKLQAERNKAILDGRDRLREVLGAREFTRFDDFVMRGIAGNIAKSGRGTGRGSVYGYTLLWYDSAAFMAIGYSATDLDYTAQIYYDAYVEGYLYLSNGFVWAKGSDSSRAGHAATFTAAYVSPSSQYSYYSDHYVRAHQEKVSAAGCRDCTRYYDPYCFSCAETARTERFAVARPGGGSARLDYSYIYLFSTSAALVTPNGVLPRAGETNLGEALFSAVEHGKPFANTAGLLPGGQAAGAASVPSADMKRARPIPVSSVELNALEITVCPASQVEIEAGVKPSLAPLAQDVAQDGRYGSGKDIRFRFWVTNYAAIPVSAWTDEYYGTRPRLTKGVEALAYKAEVLNLIRAKEREPSSFARPVVFWPGVACRLGDIDLKDWYGPLGAGHYRLTLLYRSSDWLNSNTVEFDIESGSESNGGPMRPAPKRPALPRPKG
jgi:hypothetical protein